MRPDDEIMLITDSGVLVRTRVAEIRELGRATQGVTLIALDDGAKLTGLQRIVENDAGLDAAIADADGRQRAERRRRRMRRRVAAALIALAALGVAGAAAAQTPPAHAVLAGQEGAGPALMRLQQSDVEGFARSVVERPAAQMMREAGLALQQQAAPQEKREASARAIEAEVKKYVDEAYPIVRDRASKLAPSTIGPVFEAKMTEDELRQLVAWLESPTTKKYQSARRSSCATTSARSWSPRCRPSSTRSCMALDGRIRTILGVPPAGAPRRTGGAPPARPASK